MIPTLHFDFETDLDYLADESEMHRIVAEETAVHSPADKSAPSLIAARIRACYWTPQKVYAFILQNYNRQLAGLIYREFKSGTPNGVLIRLQDWHISGIPRRVITWDDGAFYRSTVGGGSVDKTASDALLDRLAGSSGYIITDSAAMEQFIAFEISAYLRGDTTASVDDDAIMARIQTRFDQAA